MSVNVRALKERHGDSYRSLSKRSGVPRTTVERVVKGEGGITIETCNQIAAAYGLQGWQLMMKNLPEDMVESKSISKLIEGYFSSSPEGREHITRVAEREAKYKEINNGGGDREAS